MDAASVRSRLDEALRNLEDADKYLLTNNLGERCIASRLAIYLQERFPNYSVDAEYNRQGSSPKRLGLPEECANYRDDTGEALVVPDIIVHRRGPEGPNVLVIEVKKTTNPDLRGCDRQRVRAFRSQLGYFFGALVLCETRPRHQPAANLTEWFQE